MKKTLEQVAEAKKGFSNEYFRNERNKYFYICAVGIGKHEGEHCINVYYDIKKTYWGEIPDNYEGVLVVKIPSEMAEATS